MRRMMRSPLAVFAANAVRQHSLCAAERRPTVTPPGAKKRRNRTFAYRMTDSEVDPIIKNVQTIEKTTDPALDLSLAERVRLDLSWPEIGHFRCRTYGTAVPSSAGGGTTTPPPSPALVMVGSSQKDGTATSPDAQIIFADMYVTRTLAAAV